MFNVFATASATIRLQFSVVVLAFTLGACGSDGSGNSSSSSSAGSSATATGAVTTRLSISGAPVTTVTVGNLYSYIPTASGEGPSGLTYSIVNKPGWATFAPASGELSGVPTSANVGTTAGIEIVATDGMQNATVGPFSIQVLAQSQPPPVTPTIAGAPASTVTAGNPYSFTPTANGPTGKPLTFSIQNSPAWATFNTSTGQLAGTPPADGVGTYSNILISVSTGSASASLPAFAIQVTPLAANTQAQALLSYLAGLKGKGVLSGQYADFDVEGMMDQIPLITNGTGKTPAILGTFLARGNAVTMADPVALSNEWLAKGGIVIAMLSPGNPTYSADIMSGPFQSTTRPGGYAVNFKNILIPGTLEYTRWQAFLAQLVTEFKAISGPIIVRPFPELTSDWWWWGQQPPAEFIAVWQQMVTYVRSAGVTNVLWCLNFNGATLPGYSSPGAIVNAYYPGDAYVDIVSYDAYPPSASDSQAIAALTATGKPVIYAEMGAMHGPFPAPEFSADSGAALDALISNFPQVVAAVVWPRTEALPVQNGMSTFMNNPKIVNLADLPPKP